MEKDGSRKTGNLTIRLDNELLNNYRTFCEEKGYDMSKRLRLFIEKELKTQKIKDEINIKIENYLSSILFETDLDKIKQELDSILNEYIKSVEFSTYANVVNMTNGILDIQNFIQHKGETVCNQIMVCKSDVINMLKK